jgi:adenylate kinase
MNSTELVEYQKRVEDYIQNTKMTDLFENLTRILVLSKPKDPINFLVEVVENRRIQRLILVSGIVSSKRAEIVQTLSNSFNYKVCLSFFKF